MSNRAKLNILIMEHMGIDDYDTTFCASAFSRIFEDPEVTDPVIPLWYKTSVEAKDEPSKWIQLRDFIFLREF